MKTPKVPAYRIKADRERKERKAMREYYLAAKARNGWPMSPDEYQEFKRLRINQER